MTRTWLRGEPPDNAASARPGGSGLIRQSSYWSYVKAHGAKWHVRLGSPATTALKTIKVPSNQGTDTLDTSGDVVMIINNNWYANTLAKIAASHSAKNLVIFLTYDAVGCSNFTNVSTCGTGGFHSAATSSTGTHTFAWASWMEPGVFGAKSADTAAISHETAEWLNDPFVNDSVPRWSVPSEPQYGCSNPFEVGDPLVGHVFTVGRWHFQGREELFLVRSPVDLDRPEGPLLVPGDVQDLLEVVLTSRAM